MMHVRLLGVYDIHSCINIDLHWEYNSIYFFVTPEKNLLLLHFWFLKRCFSGWVQTTYPWLAQLVLSRSKRSLFSDIKIVYFWDLFYLFVVWRLLRKKAINRIELNRALPYFFNFLKQDAISSFDLCISFLFQHILFFFVQSNFVVVIMLSIYFSI